jgi:non-homologous end joining protein Ku
LRNWSCVYCTTCQLEGRFAPFARYLSGRFASGHVRFRKDQLKSNQPQYGASQLDLANHIVNQKASTFEPKKFEDHYEAALVDLINQKRSGKVLQRSRDRAGKT